MAAMAKGSGKGFVLAMAVLGILIAGLAGGVFYLRREATRAEGALREAREQYVRMVEWQRKIRQSGTRTGPKPESGGGEDLLIFLGTKSREAGIPPALLNIQKNADQKTGGWRETSFTVTLRATKDSPLAKNPVVDFLGRVEDGRPSVRSKNLNLSYVPSEDGLQSAVLTFSHFRRD